ncbi:MAG TPA: hypothetical protein VLR90_15165, partial [Blastocatellia bacterium]|nr:hypothetical protein [Blastocatellia bacterium]
AKKPKPITPILLNPATGCDSSALTRCSNDPETTKENNYVRDKIEPDSQSWISQSITKRRTAYEIEKNICCINRRNRTGRHDDNDERAE